MSTSLLNKQRFNPSRLSNLSVWLDGADRDTIEAKQGAPQLVSKWYDKSGNGNNFVSNEETISTFDTPDYNYAVGGLKFGNLSAISVDKDGTFYVYDDQNGYLHKILNNGETTYNWLRLTTASGNIIKLIPQVINEGGSGYPTIFGLNINTNQLLYIEIISGNGVMYSYSGFNGVDIISSGTFFYILNTTQILRFDIYAPAYPPTGNPIITIDSDIIPGVMTFRNLIPEIQSAAIIFTGSRVVNIEGEDVTQTFIYEVNDPEKDITTFTQIYDTFEGSIDSIAFLSDKLYVLQRSLSRISTYNNLDPVIVTRILNNIVAIIGFEAFLPERLCGIEAQYVDTTITVGRDSVTVKRSSLTNLDATILTYGTGLYILNVKEKSIGKIYEPRIDGAWAGPLDDPLSITSDANGNMYVINRNSSFVTLISPSGVIDPEWLFLDFQVNETAKIFYPGGGRLYIIQAGTSIEYDISSETMKEFTVNGIANPYYATADNVGNIYVLITDIILNTTSITKIGRDEEIKEKWVVLPEGTYVGLTADNPGNLYTLFTSNMTTIRISGIGEIDLSWMPFSLSSLIRPIDIIHAPYKFKYAIYITDADLNTIAKISYMDDYRDLPLIVESPPLIRFQSGSCMYSTNPYTSDSGSKTFMAVYQFPNEKSSINIGTGNNLPGEAFGICHIDGVVYSPYQYTYDISFNIEPPYSKTHYAFASFDASTNTLTGLAGFDSTYIRAVSYQNTICSTPITIGLTNAQYSSDDFYLCEFIATSNAMSTSDRQEMEGYLAFKWGLELPTKHPYSNFQPSGEQWINIETPTRVSGLVSWLDVPWNPTLDRAATVPFNIITITSISQSPLVTLPSINNVLAWNFPLGCSQYLRKQLPTSIEGTVLVILKVSYYPDETNSILGWEGSGPGPWGPLLRYTNDRLILQYNYSEISGGENESISVPMGPGINLIFASWDRFGLYLSVNGNPPAISAKTVEGNGSTICIGTNNTANTYISPKDLGEVVIYDQYFEKTEQQLLEGHLAWKWNIQGNLPIDHPFSKQSPIEATVVETLPLNIPAQIPTLSLWVDAGDISTLDLIVPEQDADPDTLGRIVSWRDKSATTDVFGFFGIYPTPRYMSTNPKIGPSRPGLYFSSNDSLVGTFNAAVSSGVTTCFMVATIGTGGQILTGGYATGQSGRSNSFGFVSVDNGIIAPFQGTDSFFANTVRIPTAETLTTTVLFATMSASLTDGEGVGSYDFNNPENVGTINFRGFPDLWQPSVPDAGPWVIGYTKNYPNPQDFYLHEFLCFSEYFTDTQRQLVEGYLAWKWGIQDKLPMDHPYKESRPQSA